MFSELMPFIPFHPLVMNSSKLIKASLLLTHFNPCLSAEFQYSPDATLDRLTTESPAECYNLRGRFESLRPDLSDYRADGFAYFASDLCTVSVLFRDIRSCTSLL